MRLWLKPGFWAILFLFLLSIPALYSLSLDGFYTSHDGVTHTARIAQYYKALKDGQFPPRFADSFYNGIGSPIFVYIYPLPYLFGSIIHALGFSFVDSFKILMAGGFILSAVFSYFWLIEVFKSPRAALVGAIFYVWVPYRFSLIYVRASLSELLAYTFVPLALFALTKLCKTTQIKWVAVSAVSFALVLLSQNLVALISAPVILGYAYILALLAKSPKVFFLTTVAVAWGIVISAVTYLPSLFERNFVKIDDLIQHQFVHHFVTIKQLIRSPWGYGFDLSGVANDQMSFQVGLAHILVFVIALGFLIWQLFVKKTLFFLNKPSKKTLTILFYFLVVICLFTFMMLESELVKSIWETVKPLQIIDIPWRLLGIVTLSTAFLSAFVVKNIRSPLFALFLVFAVIVANRNHLRINEKVFYADKFFLEYSDTGTQYGEFSTIWRSYLSAPKNIDPDVKFETFTGKASIIEQFSKSNLLKFTADVETSEALIKINKIYFPGVKVVLNEKELQPFSEVIIPSGEPSYFKEDNGLMIVPVKKGVNKVEVIFGETKLRQFANFLSLGSFLFAVSVIFAFRKNTENAY